MLVENKETFKTPQTTSDGDVIIVECKPEDTFSNPACDQGHSYSYQKKDLNKDKILDNFLLVEPKLSQLIHGYQLTISEDEVLSELTQDLLDLFKKAITNCNDDIKVIKTKADYLFDRIIELLQQDEEELERFENESLQVTRDSDKKEEYLNLKKELELLRNEYLVIY
jgi:hypothetical protein